MAMTASAIAARVRPGKPNTFDATAMMVEILAQKRDSREVKQLVGCLALVRSDGRFGIMYGSINMCQQLTVGGMTLA
jgi:hypothetical protein